MKLLTLLTTLIITLASSNVFAKTFICENWKTNEKKEIEGTMFVGEKDGDDFIIKNNLKEKMTLTYFAKDSFFNYYSSSYKDYTRIFSIGHHGLVTSKYNKDGNKIITFDFKIAQINGFGVSTETFCKSLILKGKRTMLRLSGSSHTILIIYLI